MKKSELKEMIRQAMLAEEMDVPMDREMDVPQISNKISLEEAEGDEDEDIEVEDIEIDAEEETSGKEEDIEVKSNAEAGITGDAKTVQDNLEAALMSAKELGDQKLVDQIGNSITFFTRTHVVGSEEVSEGEIDINVDDNAADAEAAYSIEEAYEKRRMLKIAGLK
tara:strand:- start:40 stop:537 length:498 start_codon:yes stop_codon:yes gene_type:complete